MEFFLCIFYIGIFTFLIYKIPFFRCDSLPKSAIAGIFLLKIVFGTLLFFVYTRYYKMDRKLIDIFRFYDDGLVMYETLKSSPVHFFQMFFGLFNDDDRVIAAYLDRMNNWHIPYIYGTYVDNRTMIRFNGLVSVFSFGYFHIHTIFLCFASLVGLTGIYKTFAGELREKKHLSAIAVFAVPSVLFWGSGVLKEGFLLFAMGLFIYFFFNFLQKHSLANILLLVLSGALMILIKTYILFALLPGILFLLTIRYTNPKNTVIKFISIHVLLLTAAYCLPFVLPEVSIPDYLESKQRDFINVARTTNAGSVYIIPLLDGSWWNIFKSAPVALFNALLRPFPWECNSVMMLVSSLENISIVSFCLVCVFFHKPLKSIPYKMWLFLLSYSIVLLVLLGLVTPVMGAMVRYKVPVLPFLLIAFLLLLDFQKLKKAFSR